MKISICMMVKDEEKNIRRCLDSLKPILQNIDSELVIIDTGSKDKTVQIAKEYTNKIFFHEWNNDFSAMRNKAISYAKGNWIFIIDADEEITDHNNIVRFLKSSTNNKFQTGIFRVKNMENLSDDSQYAMLKSPRLFRNDGKFHYEGIVHNNPIFKQPIIDLETTIIHYGYIQENEDTLNKKFIRTSTLLKNALEKEPENIYYIFQLSVTYTSHDDYVEGYEIIKKAYNLLDKCKDKSRYKYVYYQMALCSLKLGYDEIAKMACKEGLKLDEEYIDLMFYLGKAEGLLGEYEACIIAYKKYIYLCDNYSNININFDVSLGMYTLGQKDEALQDMVKIYFKLGKFEQALELALEIEKDKYIQNVLELIISSAISSEKISYIKKIYEEKIAGDKEKEKKFFEKLEKNYNNNEIYKAFSCYNNDYSKLYLLKYRYNENDKNLQEIIKTTVFENDFNKLEDYFGDFVYYKLKYHSCLTDIFKNVWDKNISRYLNYISQNYEDFSQVVLKYITCFINHIDNENLRINKILCRYILLVDKINDKKYVEVFKNYVNIGVKLINYIYNKNLIKDKYINFFKNNEEKFFVYMSIAIENEKDKKIYIKFLKNALQAYPYMKKGIEILKNEFMYNEELENRQFEEYKMKIKDTIINMIDIGNLVAAQETIKEYEKIVEEDIEIYSMKAIIAIMTNNLFVAEKTIQEGLMIDSTNFDLLYNLAYIYKLKNKYEKSMQIYEKLFVKTKNLESLEQLQNEIIILQRNLANNENIFLNIYDYETEFIDLLDRINREVIQDYIEYLMNKHSELKVFFYESYIKKLNRANREKSQFVFIDICKVLLKYGYKEELYEVYNEFVSIYVANTYNCENLNDVYEFVYSDEEKVRIIMYLLNKAINDFNGEKFNLLLNSLIKLLPYAELKFGTKEFYSKKQTSNKVQ